MGKSGSSTTTQKQQLPSWLTAIMQPYLRESVGSAMNMQRQGTQVLQGGNYKDAKLLAPGASPGMSTQAPKIDPELLANYYASKGGVQ